MINLQYQRSKKTEKFRYTAFLMNHDDIVNTTFANLNLYNDAVDICGYNSPVSNQLFYFLHVRNKKFENFKF